MKAEIALRLMLPYLIVKRGEAELALQFRTLMHKSGKDLLPIEIFERASFDEALKEYHKTYEYEGD